MPQLVEFHHAVLLTLPALLASGWQEASVVSLQVGMGSMLVVIIKLGLWVMVFSLSGPCVIHCPFWWQFTISSLFLLTQLHRGFYYLQGSELLLPIPLSWISKHSGLFPLPNLPSLPLTFQHWETTELRSSQRPSPTSSPLCPLQHWWGMAQRYGWGTNGVEGRAEITLGTCSPHSSFWREFWTWQSHEQINFLYFLASLILGFLMLSV